jgi:hypothetical protein
MGNPFTQALVTRLENRYAIDRVDMSMSAWIEANTKLKKKPFSLEGHHFQRAIIDDMHPNMDVVKCSQVGLTEVQLRKMLAFLVRNVGVKAIFTLPNDKMYRRVSQTRIQPMIKESAVFNPEGSRDWTRSMDLMQFDQSFLYITGATEGDATSIDADAVFNDEVDLTDQKMLSLFQSRMQASSWKISQRFSTPSHVGFGIDKGYGSSDQMEYMCRCHQCRHWNIPDFTRDFIHLPGLPDHLQDLSHIDDRVLDKLDLDDAYVMCEKCGASLDLDNSDMRAWVPRYPERSKFARGYYVRPFVTSTLDIHYILQQLQKYKQRDYIRGWYNTVLGKAFTDGHSRLRESDIRANFVHPGEIEIGPNDPCALGIDVGLICHVVIGKLTPSGLAVAKFLTVPSDEIEGWVADFAETHNLVGGAMDRQPYTPTANAVFEASKGKVYPVEYRGQKEINAVKDEVNDIQYFQANRTLLIDEVVKRVRKHKLPMAGYEHFDHLVVEHLRDMVREEEDEKEAKWVKLNGNDHYFHALGFLCFAARIDTMIENLNDADPRTLIGVLGFDMKNSNDVLCGTSRRTREKLLASDGLSVYGRYN